MLAFRNLVSGMHPELYVFTEVVIELVAHQLCDVFAKNKYGEVPSEITCSRSGDESAKLVCDVT